MIENRAQPARPDGGRNIALLLEYDGLPFHGWQVQPGVPTVQEELQRALREVTGEEIAVKGSGRTDAGVHACGQVANFRTRSRLRTRDFSGALNALTPAAVAVLDAVEVDSSFDAQYSANRKTYRYLLLARSAPSPLAAGRCWQVPFPLDLDAMRKAGGEFVGKHDFSAFRSAGCASRDPQRTLSALNVSRRGDWIAVQLSADGFLRQMVRNIVGTLVDIGRGRFAAAAAGRILRSRDRSNAGVAAPPEGLYLHSVAYFPPLPWARPRGGFPGPFAGVFSLDNQP